MTVPFEYYNLPGEMFDINAIDEDLMVDVESIIRTAKANGSVVTEEAKIAYVYDRKDYMALDDFAGPRNKAYSGNDDDLVIQVTIRINNPQSVSSVQALKNILTERKLAVDRALALLEEELAALEIHKTSTETLIEEKKKKLGELGVQS